MAIIYNIDQVIYYRHTFSVNIVQFVVVCFLYLNVDNISIVQRTWQEMHCTASNELFEDMFLFNVMC